MARPPKQATPCEWIRLNAKLLDHHPRIAVMAERLQDQIATWATGSPTTKISLDATSRIVVCAVLKVWLTANAHGEAMGWDITMPHSSRATIDQIAGIAGFCEAMESVGWVEMTLDGSIILPDFMVNHVSPDERRKRSEAVRKARANCAANAPQEEKAPRKRNVLWDLLAELFFPSGVVERDVRRLGKAVADLTAKNATPKEIEERIQRYRKSMPDCILTLESLVKHWDVPVRAGKARPAWLAEEIKRGSAK